MTFPIKKLALMCCAALMVVASTAGSAKADIYQHIDELALDIQAKSRLLLREIGHYRYTPQYRSIAICTSKMYRLARHIHEVSHFEGNLIRLQADLRDLEYEFQALEDLFDRTEIYASRGCSRIRGNTADVKDLHNAIEDCIHLLQDDVDQLVATTCPSRRARPVAAPRYPVYVPQNRFEFSYSNVRTPGVIVPQRHGTQGLQRHAYGQRYGRQTSGYGLSVGGGSSKLNIRF